VPLWPPLQAEAHPDPEADADVLEDTEAHAVELNDRAAHAAADQPDDRTAHTSAELDHPGPGAELDHRDTASAADDGQR
jgi:hypothetical protein